MSKPALDDLFTAHGRRNRKSFLWLNILLALTFFEGILILLLDVEFGWGFGETGIPAVLIIFYGVCWSVAVMMAAAQRCHDCGWSGYWALLIYVPYLGGLVWLIALIMPGESGMNHHGDDPLRFKR
ncbi:hypothetical protein LCGC14_0408340 [marine sediment metagenome]|uniref:DUF805 domain-containing protein n=2 Tax=root TaxID=1 RepID=A0A7V1BGW0_9RHOB|nr:DUF805 domain-containing protein [Sulfitobacter litoralis]HDZ53024.1 DUF805 domain-containing protein [Sulfitobacter litoralis]